MKATVNNDALLSELKKMSILIKKNAIIPITSSVKMEFEKNKLMLTATDLETTFISTIDCQCKNPFSMPVDHADILEICSNVVAPIQIELKEKAILITSGKSKYNLTVAGNTEDFPANPTDDYDVEVPVEAEFFYYLNNANTCHSKEPLKVNLNMVAIEVQKKSITVIGTDANILYKKTLDCNSKKEITVMVCDMFVQSCKGFQVSNLFIGEKFIKAECGNDIVISRLSENKFVSYKVIIPKEIEYNLPINRDELKTAVKSITVATNATSKLCSFNFTKDNIKLISKNIDYGKEAETELELSHTVAIENIGVNSGQLLHLLNIIDDSEIELAVAQHDKTIFIKPKDDNSLLLLIQPLFLTN